ASLTSPLQPNQMPPLLRRAASTATARPPDGPLLPGASTAMRFDTTTRRCAAPGAAATRDVARLGVRRTVSTVAGVDKRVIGGDASAEKAGKTAYLSTANGRLTFRPVAIGENVAGIQTLREGGQPHMQGGDRRQAMARLSAASAACLGIGDLDREAAQPVDGGEAVLIGGVVSGINRHPAGEGRLGDEIGDRRPLVAAAGDELDHLATLDEPELRLGGGDLACPLAGRGGVVRRQPVVQRQAAALVLDAEPRPRRRESEEHGPQRRQYGRGLGDRG